MKRMKKILITLLTIALIGALGGCSSNSNSETNTDVTPTTEPTAEATKAPEATTEPTEAAETDGDLSGTISITGSTSVEKILMDMIDEFTALNPDVNINYTGTGSSAGIADTLAGSNDIGASSRELKDEEKVDGLKQVIFAYDGIAVAVNPANTVTDITLEDLVKIYSGEITNWNQVGGSDANIVVVSREGASGTRGAFEELIKLEDAGGLVEDATVLEGNGNVQQSVAGNANAIGYVSFSFIDETVKALTVGGVEPTAENAKAGTYSLSRPFIFASMEATQTPVAKAFLEFAVSEDGQGFVEDHGGIRVD
ncbi:phosphate ABC transporter substrate-binding protein [Anaerocolumna cellulosilytica]|uniref:Phosphate-binding protein n=1 Tax=Anaerocolumna cellulosilytica TaxID=433286 RepID=A0A6S6RAH2_9FIRM|nr:phosphate ABC transporter substrate-binding protein [Anaerocolumna cellulosilytica]MBB5197836.1 phosphate transport system substrate-binding protein [Anaerocolumna cellulosilytica]BCJ96252.1 phosphate ABC transporter substrate-binding protein [Anaerocolumna cellulosilytica]